MLKTLAYATLLSTALAGSGALAQSPGGAGNPAAPMNRPAQAQLGRKSDAQPTKSQAGAAISQAPASVTFVTRQDVDQWRAPKLVGVPVYGPDNKQIGKIEDILISHEGAAQTVVIGIGGFLGFGENSVAVPFAAIQWRTEPRKVLAAEHPPANPVASTSGQPAGPPPMKELDPAATEASQGYPDKAILGVTLAQLKSAPDFHYAPSPFAELDSRSASGSAAMRKATP
jgi:sporulation protein YlmC with PRC-barrel domain